MALRWIVSERVRDGAVPDPDEKEATPFEVEEELRRQEEAEELDRELDRLRGGTPGSPRDREEG